MQDSETKISLSLPRQKYRKGNDPWSEVGSDPVQIKKRWNSAHWCISHNDIFNGSSYIFDGYEENIAGYRRNCLALIPYQYKGFQMGYVRMIQANTGDLVATLAWAWPGTQEWCLTQVNLNASGLGFEELAVKLLMGCIDWAVVLKAKERMLGKKLHAFEDLPKLKDIPPEGKMNYDKLIFLDILPDGMCEVPK